MKLLKKILLIKWHYIEHQIVELEDINFLTGKNGSGKSTVIDALQVVVLGDTTGYFFNKAANENSKRTLKGYLRGEVADDGDTGFLYIRNGDFTSYIVCEFLDTEKKKYITCGIVIDSYKDGEHDHEYFILNASIPENHFIKDSVPLNISALKAYFGEKYKNGFTFYRSNKSYQSAFLGKMGGLNEKFFRLIKKAVPFSPIIDIKGFISEFVCDIKGEIDIRSMQDNIRHYKLLEHEANVVNNRISTLEEIKTVYEDYKRESDRFEEQSYLMDRAKEESHYFSIKGYENEIEINNEKLEALNEELSRLGNTLEEYKQKRDKLLEEKINSDVYKKVEEYKQDMKNLKEKIGKIEEEREHLHSLAKKHYYTWRENVRCISEKSKRFSELNEFLIPAMNLEKKIELCNVLLQERYMDVKREDFVRLSVSMKNYIESLQKTYFNFSSELKDTKEVIQKLKEEIEELNKGKRSYSNGLRILKQELEERLITKHDSDIHVGIFCEMIDIKNPKWQNAVEGYLHTQKFYLIIEPKYYVEALKIYEEIKYEMNLYDVGIVDIEKLMKFNPNRWRGSLAEEIVTQSPYVQAYADFILGRVMKCNNVEELRNHRISITPTCMLYQNFVARQLNPDRYEVPYIGKNSIKKQLEIKKEQHSRATEKRNNISSIVEIINKAKNIEVMTENDINSIIYWTDEVKPLKRCKEDLKELADKLGSLDFTYINRLNDMLKYQDGQIQKVEKEIKDVEKDLHNIGFTMEDIEKNKIPEEKMKANYIKDQISEKYDEKWIQDVGIPRYDREIQGRKIPNNILIAFSSQIRRTESQKNTKWDNLIEARKDYIRNYKLSYDAYRDNNIQFDNELKSLQDTLLIEYRSKIEDSKEKAKTQFQEDFISKLRRNIEDVREQIDSLNNALRDVPFGREKYKFKVEPNRMYKDFYDMITDNMLLEGFNLFSMEFLSRHKGAIDQLFKQIVDVGESELNTERRIEIERNLEKFTDYRTYLDFDLIVMDDTGRESRLSKVIAKKSGGETQTPFYISVLASFLQLYRVRQRGYNNTLRLIVFDEAYSKMDHQRIQESMRLLRKMGLQVIVSAPTEKIGDIAPFVDRTHCVTRVKNQTVIEAFDPRKVLEG